MYKLILFLFVFLITGCALFPGSAKVPAIDSYAAIAPVLDSAETFFISLKDRKYGAAWDLLSKRSRKTIITAIYKASKKNGEDLQQENIENDFKKQGIISNAYWDAFLKNFDPDMVLEESRWDMGPVNKDKAEIIIIHKKSNHPAILQMFKENEIWKVGFSESFKNIRF